MLDPTDVLCALLALLTIVGALMVILSPLVALLVWKRMSDDGSEESSPPATADPAFPVILRERGHDRRGTGPQGFEP